MQKRCQLCRNHFDCKDSGDCWCWNADVKPYLARIPAGIDDCICQNCLMNLAERPVEIKKKKQDYVAGSSVAGIGP